MTLGLWLRLYFGGKAICEGGPFNGDLRTDRFRRITIGGDGHEWAYYDPYDDGTGEPGPCDIGCYERDGRHFVWRGKGESDRRAKVRAYINGEAEIDRIIARERL